MKITKFYLAAPYLIEILYLEALFFENARFRTQSSCRGMPLGAKTPTKQGGCTGDNLAIVAIPDTLKNDLVAIANAKKWRSF